jgi:hypothetical protein
MPRTQGPGIRSLTLCALLLPATAGGSDIEVSLSTGTTLLHDTEAVAGLTAGLREAAAMPEQAARIFDNLGRRLADSKLQAPDAVPAGRVRNAKGLGNAVPPSPPPVRLKRRDGTPNDGGRASGYEVDLGAFSRSGRGEARAAASRALARAVADALGVAPGYELVVPLANLLRDLDEYAPEEGWRRARLILDRDNPRRAPAFRLVYDRRDGTRRVIAGQLADGTAFRGHAARSLIITGAVAVDADGHVTQDRPGYWREYTGEDTRLEWFSRSRVVEKGWGPWARTDTLLDVTLQRQAYVSGHWRAQDQELKKTVTDKEGRTSLGETGAAFLNVKYLGAALDFCGQVAKSAYNGLVMLPTGLLAAAGSDGMNLEYAASAANNPLSRAIYGDESGLGALSGRARGRLDAKARELRRQALAGQPFPIPASVVDQAVGAAIGDQEAAAVLADNYGAGAYGKRLIHEGVRTTGLPSWLYTAGGVLTGACETVAESMLNPMVLATFGLGQAAAALDAPEVMAQASTTARAAAMGASWGYRAVASALTTAFLSEAADDIGKTVAAAAAGKFDEADYDRLSATSADLLFLGLMRKGWRDQRGQAKALPPAGLGEDGRPGLGRAIREQFGRRFDHAPTFSEVLAGSRASVLPWKSLKSSACPKDRPERQPGPPEVRDQPRLDDAPEPRVADLRRPGDEREPDLSEAERERGLADDAGVPVDSSGSLSAPAAPRRSGFNPSRGRQGPGASSGAAFGAEYPGGLKAGSAGAGNPFGAGAGRAGGDRNNGGYSSDGGMPGPVPANAGGIGNSAGAGSAGPEPPAGPIARAAAEPEDARPKSMTAPQEPPAEAPEHAPAAELAKKFDGAGERPKAAEKKNDSPAWGAAGSGSSSSGSHGDAWPQSGQKGVAAGKSGTAAAAAPSAGPIARAKRAPARKQAAAVKTVPEDFTYTYLPPARHSYEFPKELPRRTDDSVRKFREEMGVRVSAAGAVGYLFLYSNFPYLIGVTRRKRRQ